MSAHWTVNKCSEEAKYMLYSCAREGKGLAVCANVVEDPDKGTAVRWQNHVDEDSTCSRCGKKIRYCWSWIPL